MRKKIIAGNWKMNKTLDESKELAEAVKKGISGISDVESALCPPFTSLTEVAKVLEGSNIGLGAQNCYWLESGAYTGEVAPSMIKSTGAAYVIIGHSERRGLFNETNESVNKKVKAALDAGLLPIMCVGEKLEEREKNRTFDVVKSHVEGGLKGINENDAKKIVIAYEPVWAIGTGKNATPEQAEEVHAYIRGLLKDLYSDDVADTVRIQYGGSVKPSNVEGLMGHKDIDGALVGGASLEADSFIELVKKTSEG